MYSSFLTLLIVFHVFWAPSSAETRLSPAEALRTMVDTRFDSAGSVEILSEENSFHSRNGIISRICYVEGVWLLMQRDADSSEWQRGAILVRGGVAYYAEVGGTPHLAGGACVSCHTNGPMLLRGAILSGAPAIVHSLNSIVHDQGLIEAYIPPSDPIPESDSLTLRVCARCHDGIGRSKLFDFQVGTIYYQTWSRHMPPDRALSPPQMRAVMDWIRTHPQPL